ncbi:MAG: LytTR family DNA-binding domain-containing protein [Bacteroidota bacterium]
MKALIIEDEEKSALKLKKYLEQLDTTISVLDILGSIKESIQFLRENLELDVIFLDVQLTDGESFEIFEEVSSKAFIIFVTAYDQHALKAFNLNTVSYLLKPFDQSDVAKAVKKFYSYKEQSPGLVTNDRFLVKKGNRSYTFSVEGIALFIKDEVLFLVSRSGEKFLVDATLDKLERSLSSTEFFRINRSALVRYDAIESFASDSSHRYRIKLKQIDHEELIVSQSRAAAFKKWIQPAKL